MGESTGSLFASPNVDDPYVILQIGRNPDGSLTRPDTSPLSPPDSSPSSPVLSKDVTLNPTRKTWIRIFRPQNPSPTTLPIIIFFHGGGFILSSAASKAYHDYCEKMAGDLSAIVVSVEYRLAPEHRLPAAYDDADDAILWVRDESHSDPWFDSADRSRCFLMGNSAGGNIVYHAGLRAVGGDLNIAGLIMTQPFFDGKERTASLVHYRIMPLAVSDLIWELSLPEGSDRDHEFCNPMAHADRVGQLPRCLVTGNGEDPLVDRQRELVRMLEGRGVEVVSHFDDDGIHGVEMVDPRKWQQLMTRVNDFVSNSSIRPRHSFVGNFIFNGD